MKEKFTALTSHSFTVVRLLLFAAALLCLAPPARADLVAYWTFDNAASLGEDSAGGSILTANGGASHTATGKFGGGLALSSGASQFLSGTVNNLPIGDTAYTISAWIKTSTSGYMGIVGWGNYGTNNQVNAFRTNTSGYLLNYWWSDDLYALAAGYNNGAWRHVAVTYDGTTRRIYMDGAEKGSDTPGTLSATATNFRIGSTNSAEFFNGSLDDIAIFSHALSASEVLGIASSSSSLVTLVTNTNDSGAGSLRQAIADTPGGGTITFDPAVFNGEPADIVTLGGTQLTIDKNLTIDASAIAAGVIIDANGGSRVLEIKPGSTVSLTSLTLTGGNATGATSVGGGIYCASATLTLDRCTISGNSSTFQCGGFFQDGGTSTITNSTISGNTTTGNGGGFYISNLGVCNLSNSTVSGNSCSAGGGGGFMTYASAQVNIVQSTIANNTATLGGGIHRGLNAIVSLQNSIVAGNTASTGPDINGAVASHSGVNFIGNTTNATGLGTANTDYLTGNAMLGTLGDNGGPTQTMPPLAGSPVIDAGGTTDPGGTDQRGFPRFVNGALDIGAVEVKPVFYVRQTATTGSNNGTSWANAYTKLQDALAATSSGSEIHVAAGTYYPDETGASDTGARTATFQLKNGVTIYGGFPAAGGSFAQRDPAAYPTKLSGDIDQNDTTGGDNSGNAYHVLTGSGTGATALLDGFTITAGNANGSFPNNGGGGLLNLDPSSPSLTRCSFEGNFGSGYGGAIFNYLSSPALTNCSFQGNSGFHAGAIYNYLSSPALTNCSFQGNSGFFAGAIYNAHSSSPALTNCILWNNMANGYSAGTDASVYNVYNDASTPTYSHCLVANSGGSEYWIPFLGTDLGNNLDVDPLFLLEIDPASAPATGGNLGLDPSSPALNAGLNSVNTTPTDLAGKPRILNTTIDLGAFELLALYVRASATTGSNNGTSWANAYTKLQDALAAASAGVQIVVSAGSYYPDETGASDTGARTATFQLKNGVAILGGFPAGGGSFAQRDPAAYPTKLSGDIDQNDTTGGDNSGNAYHVLTGSGTNATALLDGFTITAGNADGSYPGGGLLNLLSNSSPTLIHCSFQGNSARSKGGAIYNYSSSPALTHCSFQGNSATSAGGAIYNDRASSPALITNCSFKGNSAFDGGAIFNYSSLPALTNCSFEGNSSSRDGGAIFSYNSPITLTNCSFQGNSADRNAGAIFNAEDVSATFTNCSFQGNSAQIAGAIRNFHSSLTVTNCILWNNMENGSATAPGASVSNEASAPTYSHCLVQNWTAASLGGPGNLDGTNPANNPLFLREINPASAPATGGDLRLDLISPVLNAGLNSANTTPTDLAGNPRIFNTTIDLGAFELLALYVSASATTGSNNGTSWVNAYTTLHAALHAAPASAGVQIVVAAGTYYPDETGYSDTGDRNATFQLKNGVAIYGGFPAGGGSFAQRDPAAYPTKLSGDIDQNDTTGGGRTGNAYHVLTGSGTNATALVDGFTITAGNANGSFPNNGGGGLLNLDPSSPTLTRCSFEGNFGSGFGGAIFNYLSSPALTNCSFQGNSASSTGGAIHNSWSSPALTNCSFQGNSAFYAGAIYNDRSSSPALTNCSFQGNSGFHAGAIYNASSSPALTNCILWNNMANGYSAGADASVYNEASTPTYSHCLVANSGGSGSWNASLGTDLGNNLDVDPLFLLEIDPASAPATGGNLGLDPSSPALDAGLNSANTTPTDLVGNPRIFNTTIDLGAFELLALYVRASATTGSNNGTSWANAYTKLQDALAAASAGVQIVVAAGTYYPDETGASDTGARTATFQLKNGVAILGGFPAAGGSFAQRDPTAYPTKLSGDIDQNDTTGGDNSGNAYHVLTGSGTNATALLDGFTITAGNADGSYPGGGLLNLLSNSSPTLIHCSFLGNSARSKGGAIYNFASSPTLTHCSFKGNSATSAGGAIYNDRASSPALITNCSFKGNSAFDGGAIFNYSSLPALTNCSFEGNSSSRDGGAIFSYNSPITLTNCSFQGNSADRNAGAIFNAEDVSAIFTNCSFQGNSAQIAGAIRNFHSTLTVTNCILWNNMENGSTTAPGASVSNQASTPTYSHCLVQNWTAASLGGPGNLDGTNPANSPLFLREIDPASAPDTGGNLRLGPGSPALDVGLNSANSTLTDLAGTPRIQNTTIDLGAYEGVGIDVATLWPTDDDLDGNPYGVELALGTDPDISDPGNPANLTKPSFNASGHATFTFGRNPDAPAGTIWKLMRSTTLLPGSFGEIFRFDGTTKTDGLNITSSVGGTSISVTDEEPPPGNAYYRFEAIHVP